MSETTAVAPAPPNRTQARHPFRVLLRNPIGVASLVLLAGFVIVAIGAPWLAPFGPNEARVALTNAPPFSSEYLLGGDAAGRDVLSRLIWGARTTLLGSVIVLSVSLSIGVVSGLLAGYYGRTVESVGNWLSDVILALPGVVLLIALYAVIGSNVLIAMAVYGVMVSPVFYRLVRGVVVGVRRELYIDAAKVSGLSDARIIFKHVLRAVRSPIIIQSAFILGTAIGIQSTLEFLGLGSPSEASWGGMLGLAFQNIYVAGFGVLWPALVVTLAILAFVLLGNALRDALDPSAKRARISKKVLDRVRSTRVRERTQGADTDALLTVRGLTVAYPTGRETFSEVVSGVDLEVARGEILGLVGESGSGKSQTAFAVLGVLPDDAIVVRGSVRFDGSELLDHPEHLRAVRGIRIAYIPQEPMTNLDPSMTIGRQLTRALRAIRPMSRGAAERRLEDLLGQVGIRNAAETMRKFPHQISGGMAQRVLIAGAVAGDPDLIIADEPTTALDVTVQADVLDVIRDLRDERGLAVVLVTHDLGVVADICDRVSVMKEGRVLETAPAADFFAGPREEYSRELLAAVAELE